MYPNNFQRPPLVSRDQYSPTDSRPPGLFGEVDERTRPSTAFSSNNQISHVAGIHEGFTLVHFPPVYPRETDEQGLQHDLPSTNHNSYQPFVPAPQQQPPSSAAVGFIQATLPHGAPQRHYHMSGSIRTPWSSDNRQSMYQSPVTNDIAVHPHIPTQLPFSAARIFGLPVSYQARQSLIADPVLAIRSMSASDQHHTFGISVDVSQLPTGITPNSTVPYHGEALSSMSQTPAGISSSSAKFDADKADIECTQRHYREFEWPNTSDTTTGSKQALPATPSVFGITVPTQSR
ncbi:hypothetical protein BS17DRAFT_184674 [Gyrodon lividus]|nr:hypothetical protein BS17DRAFT_184674 [Gyrodon lividus]